MAGLAASRSISDADMHFELLKHEFTGSELVACGKCISGSCHTVFIATDISKNFDKFRKLGCVYIHRKNVISRRKYRLDTSEVAPHLTLLTSQLFPAHISEYMIM
jgi:hypothetical protein